MIPGDTIITANDVKKAGICIVPGARDWWAKQGWDFRDFIRNGIAASKLRETGDAFALKVLDVKEARENG